MKNTYNEFSIKTALVLAYFSTSAALSSMPSTPRLRAGLRRQYRKYKDKSNYVQCPVRTIKPTLTRPRLDAPAREGLSLAFILSHPLHTSRCQRSRIIAPPQLALLQLAFAIMADLRSDDDLLRSLSSWPVAAVVNVACCGRCRCGCNPAGENVRTTRSWLRLMDGLMDASCASWTPGNYLGFRAILAIFFLFSPP